MHGAPQHIPQSIDTTGWQQVKLPPGEESCQGTENLTTPSKISCVAELEDCGCAPSSPRHLLGAPPRKQQGVNQQRTSTQPTITKRPLLAFVWIAGVVFVCVNEVADVGMLSGVALWLGGC